MPPSAWWIRFALARGDVRDGGTDSVNWLARQQPAAYLDCWEFWSDDVPDFWRTAIANDPPDLRADCGVQAIRRRGKIATRLAVEMIWKLARDDGQLTALFDDFDYLDNCHRPGAARVLVGDEWRLILPEETPAAATVEFWDALAAANAAIRGT